MITDSFGSQEKYMIVFGKAGPEVYNLDIEYPFSLVQGIAVALTTFETKITCDWYTLIITIIYNIIYHFIMLMDTLVSFLIEKEVIFPVYMFIWMQVVSVRK